jgi:hypothetical protein
MKDVIIGILLALFLAVSGYCIYLRKHPEQVIVNNTVTVENQKKVDSLKWVIDGLSSHADTLRMQRNAEHKKSERFRIESSDAWEYADSLEQAYNDNKTISGCDSTISAKNSVISKKNDLITSLDNEAKTYSHELFICNDISEKRALVITKQSEIITESSYYKAWFDNHKFWRWIHGVKCK